MGSGLLGRARRGGPRRVAISPRAPPTAADGAFRAEARAVKGRRTPSSGSVGAKAGAVRPELLGPGVGWQWESSESGDGTDPPAVITKAAVR